MESKGLSALRIRLASPDVIRSWSYGEVLKPETINYRRLRPEKDGLFCEAIFGPTRDYQCHCGKYKNIRYRGIICDKCGVEVTRSSVRRERMGHIELAAPVAHIWYTRRVPSYLGLLLDISRRNLDRVLYFAQYVVTHVDEESRQKALKRLDEKYAAAEAELMARVSKTGTGGSDDGGSLKDRKDALEPQYEELFEKEIQPIIKAGQRLEESLQEDIGQTVRKAILFPETNAIIAEAGETISTQHLGRVQQFVKERFEDIEGRLKEQKQQDIERITLEVSQVKAESDKRKGELQSKYEDQLDALRHDYNRQRSELTELSLLTFMGESRYRELKSRWGQVFRADMGAEAFYDILKRIDLDKLANELWVELRTSKSKQKRKRAIKRLKVVKAFQGSGNRPEWMVLTVLPVIPPDLRPMVQLDGGRFATSDLNDLYRRVINRNNRLKRLLELGAPDVIVRNEKRMLQEAVDSLVDNSQRGRALSRRGRRELKSLSDMLKGKKGRFRRNLLGKRVDYSGRSVIVVGPQLKIHQCGLPKTMALELYRPFVIGRLVKNNYANNVKGAKRFIERGRPEVYEVLEQVIKEHPVLLNRAPTLHRLGIQAFEPILIEGSAIQLHPLVTTAFNADFDGDQMAVHVPLSQKAVTEARELMLSSKNLLKPADGEPIISPSKDMVLGVYYLTYLDKKDAAEFDPCTTGRIYADMDEVDMAYSLGKVKIHQQICYLTETWFDENHNRLPNIEKRVISTTVGRVLFNRILPAELRFVNRMLDKGGIKDLVADVYEFAGSEATTLVVDNIKDIGFTYATRSGHSIAITDVAIPKTKQAIVDGALAQVGDVQTAWLRGKLTEQERDERLIEIWQSTTIKVADQVRAAMDPNGNLATMANSGATKGGFGPISQMAGMRGLMADPRGRIIPLPIRSNFREGLTALEYFISTHGARKGLSDTALRTADAGYLTRRLVDIAQDVIINDDDCGTEEGIWIRKTDDVAGQSIESRLFGRMIAERVIDPATGEVVLERGDILDKEHLRKITRSQVAEVKVRSPLTCDLIHGVCAKCYGMDLGRGELVKNGTAVGIVAAQSIGEPGTQLTLRTFHTGGVAAGGDITTGLPRVEELLEARKTPKGEAVVAEIGGTVHIEQSDRYSNLRIVRIEFSEMQHSTYDIPAGWQILAKDGGEVREGESIATLEGMPPITAQTNGRVRVEGTRVFVSYQQNDVKEYDVPSSSRLSVKEGDKVVPGQPLTEGSLNPHKILALQGREECQRYLLSEVQKVYRSQGQNINDKHFEIILRKMLSRVQVSRPGESGFLPHDLINRLELRRVNEKLVSHGKQTARFVEVLLGITKASLTTDSWLSASSFQHTIKVLAGAAISSSEDTLFGLKENVIIGKLIPAGTGYVPGRFDEEPITGIATADEIDKEASEEDFEEYDEDDDMDQMSDDIYAD